ncbi:iron complex outermembrane receptor protein [Novosphingobium chloroacetimidivorans]|uniref:Iron complex outermembrane receptor protein n=1 Tax=Novosphingobium chloroacetimidivorans TaxID=1428314 RepID=A0A7W7K9D6_9SPHN|nr:TonB-dependent receptor [Novosphingobium chloroacetimidivorans]MBB4857983.1 iron complex outermembrane receptor protein [Novosphingobium chloroacetimidivorans]
MRLGFQATCASAMALGLVANPALAQDEQAPTDEIIVNGRAQRLYRVDTTTVGKVAEDPINIPQALQVINAELFRDQGARDATDLYRNISGVSFFSYAGVTFRGFRQDQSFYDGQRGNPFIGFSVPQLFNISRVEVLKGPAGLFFGPGSPGGIINYVSKVPEDKSSLRLVGTMGNYNRAGMSAEATGPVDVGGVVSYRLGGFYESMAPYRTNTKSKSLIGDGGLSIKTNPGGKLTLQATIYDNDLPGNRLRGILTDDAGNFLTDIRWNANEPTDFLHLKSKAFQARYVTNIGDAVTFDAGARYFKSKETQQYHEPRGLVPGNPDLVAREFRDQIRDVDGLSFMANVTAKIGLLGMAHQLQAGADWYDEKNLLDSRILRAGVTPLSLSNPVYVTSARDVARTAALPFTTTDTRTKRKGAYLQDQISVTDALLLVGGVRYDKFDDGVVTSTGGRVSAGSSYSDGDVTYRAGAVFKPRPDASLYFSWSGSFEPQAAASQSTDVGGPFAPVTGKQIEAGIKSNLFAGRLQANLAVYRIVRRNILQADVTLAPVNGQDQLRPIGEVTSKGFEVDLATDITPDWVLLANYGYNDTKITDTVVGQAVTNAVGNRFANAPKHKVGFWTRYQFPAIGAAIGFGGEHVSRRISLSGQQVKPYTIFDASVTKGLGFAELLLRVDNIFDKVYAASGFSAQSGHFPGEPRTFLAEMRFGF